MRRFSIPIAFLITFAAVYRLAPGGPGAAASEAESPAETVYYPGCNAARAAGVAPIYRGQPGYREEMDGDGDGIACEPHRSHSW